MSTASSPTRGQQASSTHIQMAPPPEIREDMNIKDWKLWREHWADYEVVAKLDKESAKYRAAVFRGYLGREGRGIYNGLPFQQVSDRDDVDTALELLEFKTILLER